MPDVDVLDTTNGHHEEFDGFSPLDMLSPHGVSASDAAGESTDETCPPAEHGHVEEETKGKPPAQKSPSKPTATKPTVVKKARVIIPFLRPIVICLEISSS